MARAPSERPSSITLSNVWRTYGGRQGTKSRRIIRSANHHLKMSLLCPFLEAEAPKRNGWSWTGESGYGPLPVTWTWRAGKRSMSSGCVQSLRAPRTCFSSHVKLKCLAACWICVLIFVHLWNRQSYSEFTPVTLWTVPNQIVKHVCANTALKPAYPIKPVVGGGIMKNNFQAGTLTTRSLVPNSTTGKSSSTDVRSVQRKKSHCHHQKEPG